MFLACFNRLMHQTKIANTYGVHSADSYSYPSHPVLIGILSLLTWAGILTYWWMQHFGGLTAKRHLGVSNAATIGELDWGRLKASVRSRLSSSKLSQLSRIGPNLDGLLSKDQDS